MLNFRNFHTLWFTLTLTVNYQFTLITKRHKISIQRFILNSIGSTRWLGVLLILLLALQSPIRFTRFKPGRIIHFPWWQLCPKISWLFRNIWISLFTKHTSFSVLASYLHLFSCRMSCRIWFILLFNFYGVFSFAAGVFVNLLHLRFGQVFKLWWCHVFSFIDVLRFKFRGVVHLLTAVIWEKWF